MVEAAHPMMTHRNGDKCIWDGQSWFVPLDAGGEGYDCHNPEHAEYRDAEIERLRAEKQEMFERFETMLGEVVDQRDEAQNKVRGLAGLVREFGEERDEARRALAEHRDVRIQDLALEAIEAAQLAGDNVALVQGEQVWWYGEALRLRRVLAEQSTVPTECEHGMPLRYFAQCGQCWDEIDDNEVGD